MNPYGTLKGILKGTLLKHCKYNTPSPSPWTTCLRALKPTLPGFRFRNWGEFSNTLNLNLMPMNRKPKP